MPAAPECAACGQVHPAQLSGAGVVDERLRGAMFVVRCILHNCGLQTRGFVIIWSLYTEDKVMKYKLISVFIVGLLAAGLYSEAASVENESSSAVKMEDTNEISEDKQETIVDMGASTSGEDVGQPSADGQIQVQSGDAVQDAAEPQASLDMYGGIRASLDWNSIPYLDVPDQVAPLTGSIGTDAFATQDGAVVLEEPTAQDESVAQELTPGDADEAEQESEYADLALANVTHYVNVRTEPNTSSTIVGKIYHGAVAQILETTDGEDGEWFRIVSGNVEGYIKSEFFLYGAAAEDAIEDYVTRYAVVEVDRLNVRKEADVESGRIGYVDRGEKVEILENLGEWMKVQYTESKTGYVAAQYVTVKEEFVYAKTLEEEAAELAAKRALEERQSVPETAAAENTTVIATPPSGDYSTNSELRAEVVNYAMQFLGNRYVHGGSSLESGTDCSGFTSLIYAVFGYSVSRTPSGQLSSSGRSIDYSEAQPGDIICYGSKKCTHVGLYIGDGQIIHSANSRKGVIISDAKYDNILGVKNVID